MATFSQATSQGQTQVRTDASNQRQASSSAIFNDDGSIRDLTSAEINALSPGELDALGKARALETHRRSGEAITGFTSDIASGLSGTGTLAGLANLGKASAVDLTALNAAATQGALGSSLTNKSQLSQTLTPTELKTLRSGIPSLSAGGAMGSSQDLGDLVSQTKAQASGADPRFAAFRNAQLDQLRSQEASALGRESEFFNRRGLAGTSAALNQQGRTQAGFQQQARTLSSQMDLQALQNQQQQQGQLGNLLASQFQQNLGGRQQQFGEQQAAAQFGLGRSQFELGALQAQFGQHQAVAGQELQREQIGFNQALASRQQNLAALTAQAEQIRGQEEMELGKTTALAEILGGAAATEVAYGATKPYG